MKNSSQLFNKLFTRKVFGELVNRRTHPIFHEIVEDNLDNPNLHSNGEIVSTIYALMAKSYRNEYFYQNTLLNSLLLGKHSVRTTTALSQVPIGKAVADFILINGKAVVYEIKSDLDNFDRLDSQIQAYYQAFDHVCVVAPESSFSKLQALFSTSPVGIYTLTKRNTISATYKKEPIADRSKLSHQSLFKLLRKREYEHIVYSYYGFLPEATPVFWYEACESLFSKIPMDQAYPMVLNTLKQRVSAKQEHLLDVPYSLRSLAYFSRSSYMEPDSLHSFLSQQYRW